MNRQSAHPESLVETSALEVYLLGFVDFDAALFLQERLVYELSGRNDGQGAVLICEHPPLVTIGREGSRAYVEASQQELLARQLELRWINRGGGCLVHGPGQLAVYPIIPLSRREIRPAEYPARLIETVVDLSAELRVSAWPSEDGRGVSCRLGRFAEIGAAVKSNVAYHGLFLNVAPAMDLMRLVNSGPRGERLTSLSAQRGRAMEMHTVREAMIRHLKENLGYSRHHVYTGHPLLKRTIRQIPQTA